MAVTITYDGGLNTNKSLNSWTSRGKKMATGNLNFSGLTYPTSGGVTTNFAGFSTLDFVAITAQDGLFFEYDYSNTAIIVREVGTATATSTIAAGENLLQEVSNVSIGSWNAVRFFAVGD